MIRHPLKRLAAMALFVATLLSPVAQQAAQAQGVLGNLLSGLCVREGCGTFTGPLGTPVRVISFMPKPTCPAPAVIILHGADGGTTYMEDYRTIGRGLASQGYAAFFVHYYDGAPNAPRPGPNDRDLPDRRAFYPWMETVGYAISYVQGQPGVDPNRIGLLGMSLGGFMASSVSGIDPRVKAAVIVGGGLPDELAPNVRRMPPALIVHGALDHDVPVANAYKLHHLLSQRGLWHDLEILPCEGHLPFKDKEHVARRVLAFLNRTL